MDLQQHRAEGSDAVLPTLDAIEQRVLGSLLEKERTVPATYPMTRNALRTACNQSSSREPIMEVSDAEVEATIDRLKALGLARIVHAAAGSRSVKYRQVADERLRLEDAERALLTVLLLRGPQAAGELRTRTERLHPFADRSEVEACLEAMAARRPALVVELPRRRGQHDPRWVHLLGPVAEPGDGDGDGDARRPGAAVDRDLVLAEGREARDARVRTSYDALAGVYADQLLHELDRKPFDRWLLDRLASLAEGPIADAGCGPGHVAFHLACAGAEVTGFDLSPNMVREACRRFPELAVEVADLRSLPAPRDAEGWGGIVAWYSLVHLAGSELSPTVASLASVLRPGGWLAIAVHVGDEVHHATELLDVPVDVHVVFHDADEVIAAFEAAGLADVEWYRRGPLPEAEAETERLYVLGRRPDRT